eukprot:CAMPEP_0203808838 /NCGR_PEP_ID=MMETSP0115-20131106/1831_1 /ASSEMBLY_ACC=CAM_ASM_000227 /TAXON_ID=33651 /ORGANISM="Bicosoecid sp, Strain ms1" /LENGTH=116 /DNA_ID=CAMNT_0050717537 /DNA_START=120 /DNA_END=467 /DNA_ORIENTATION=-
MARSIALLALILGAAVLAGVNAADCPANNNVITGGACDCDAVDGDDDCANGNICYGTADAGTCEAVGACTNKDGNTNDKECDCDAGGTQCTEGQTCDGTTCADVTDCTNKDGNSND